MTETRTPENAFAAADEWDRELRDELWRKFSIAAKTNDKPDWLEFARFSASLINHHQFWEILWRDIALQALAKKKKGGKRGRPKKVDTRKFGGLGLAYPSPKPKGKPGRPRAHTEEGEKQSLESFEAQKALAKQKLGRRVSDVEILKEKFVASGMSRYRARKDARRIAKKISRMRVRSRRNSTESQ